MGNYKGETGGIFGNIWTGNKRISRGLDSRFGSSFKKCSCGFREFVVGWEQSFFTDLELVSCCEDDWDTLASSSEYEFLISEDFLKTPTQGLKLTPEYCDCMVKSTRKMVKNEMNHYLVSFSEKAALKCVCMPPITYVELLGLPSEYGFLPIR